MAKEKVSAKITKFNTEIDVDVDIFSDDLDELVSNLVEKAGGKLSEEEARKVVASNANRNMIITLQSNIRRWAVVKDATSGEEVLADADDIQKKVDTWIPGVVQREGKSVVEKMAGDFNKMTPEKQAEFLAYAQSIAAAAAAK